MNQPNDTDLPNDADLPQEADLVDRHLAGVLTPEEEVRLEELIRSSPAWARRYREAEDLDRVLRTGLGAGAPAPRAVKDAIRARVAMAAAPSRRRWSPWAMAAAAAVLVAVGAAALWPRDKFMPTGFPDEPLALKDLARRSAVAFEAITVLRDGRVRVQPGRTLYGALDGRAVTVPASLAAGNEVVVFGERDGNGMIRPVDGMRGIVHLSGVQRWEGADRRPEETRTMVAQAAEQRTLAATLADIEAFLASDESLLGERAGLLFSADVSARHLGTFPFDAVVKHLLDVVMDGNKHPTARRAAAKGLERSDRARACEVLLQAVLQQPMSNLQAESEDGHVVMDCLQLIARNGGKQLAASLRKVANSLTAPALRTAAEVALQAVTGVRGRDVPPVVDAPQRVSVGGHECVLMGGANGQRRGLLVVCRGREGLPAFRPVVNTAIARGFSVLVLPSGVRDWSACVAHCVDSGLARTDGVLVFAHPTAEADAAWLRRAASTDRVIQMAPGEDVAQTLARTSLDALLSR